MRTFIPGAAMHEYTAWATIYWVKLGLLSGRLTLRRSVLRARSSGVASVQATMNGGTSGSCAPAAARPTADRQHSWCSLSHQQPEPQKSRRFPAAATRNCRKPAGQTAWTRCHARARLGSAAGPTHKHGRWKGVPAHQVAPWTARPDRSPPAASWLSRAAGSNLAAAWWCRFR
jgi:hypothetical protein